MRDFPGVHRAPQAPEQNDAIPTDGTDPTLTDPDALSGHLIRTHEEELRQISRHLHDDLAQRAAIAEMQVDHLAEFLRPGEGAETLRLVKKHLADLSNGLRDMSHRLHPSVVEDLGLSSGIQQLVDEFAEAGGAISFDDHSGSAEPDTEAAVALYRIVQEALHNTRAHAPGAPVRVVLRGTPDELEMSVEDAGPGFRADSDQQGLGLLRMKELARLAGGTLDLRSEPDEGTLILVRVPMR